MAKNTIAPSPIKKGARVRKDAPVNVVNLQEARSARKMAERKPVNNSESICVDPHGEKRNLLWVSERESCLLSTMYEGRVNDAVSMVKAMMNRN